VQRPFSFLEAALVSLLVLGAGCSVPPTRYGRDVREISAKAAEMQKAVDEERWETALSRAKEIAKLGDALSAKVFIGDPLRKALDEALAEAREVREQARQQESRPAGAGRERLEAMARQALEDAAANKKEPKAVPEGAESISFLDGVPDRAPRRIAAVADTGDTENAPRRAGGEFDLDRHTTIVQGDKEGDISDDEIFAHKRREKEAKELAPRKLRIGPDTPPLVISQKPITKGKSVAAYFTVTNNTTEPKYVVSVNADFIRETGKKAGFANVTFRVEGFIPKWNDILDSKGVAVTGDGVPVEAMSTLQLVAVGSKPKIGKIEKVKLEVRMRTGKVRRLTGPKELED